MNRGAVRSPAQRMIFIAAVAVTIFLVAFFIVPTRVWFSAAGILLAGGIVAVAVVASYAAAPEPPAAQAAQAVREGLAAATGRAVVKHALFWIGVVVVIALVFYWTASAIGRT